MGPDVSTLSGQFYIKNIFYIKSNRPEISQIINSTSLKYQASLAGARPYVAPTCQNGKKGIRGGGTRAKTTFYTRVVGIADTADPTLRSGSPLRAPVGALWGPYCAAHAPHVRLAP